MKRALTVLLTIALTLSLALALGACTQSSDTAEKPKEIVVKVGTTSDEPRIWDAVQKNLDAENAGIKLEFLNLAGGQPNVSLADGEVDINSFQHYAYFNKEKEDLSLDLTAIGDTLIVPLSLFSTKHKALSDIPQGGKIALPADATNQGRALLVLKNAGLLDIDPAAGNNARLKDITSNPQNLEFVELEGPQIPHALADVDAAVINCGYATDFGLDPVNDPLYKDEIDLKNPEQQPFINIIVARTADKDNPTYLKIVEAYQTASVAEAIGVVYKNAAIPAFTVK